MLDGAPRRWGAGPGFGIGYRVEAAAFVNDHIADRRATNREAVLRRPPRHVALMLIDVINALDFEGSAGIVRAAERAAPRIERLTRRARAASVPVIYANDNFGKWRSDFQSTVRAC